MSLDPVVIAGPSWHESRKMLFPSRRGGRLARCLRRFEIWHVSLLYCMRTVIFPVHHLHSLVAARMRLIAVPIARAKAGATPVSTFLAQRTPIKPSFTSHKLAEAKASASAKDNSATSAETSTKEEEKPPLSKRLLERASKFWIDLGREDQTSTFDWKKRTYRTGERLMDQIEYEEWALKAVDPAIGPGLSAPEGKGRREDRREARADGTETALRDVSSFAKHREEG